MLIWELDSGSPKEKKKQQQLQRIIFFCTSENSDHPALQELTDILVYQIIYWIQYILSGKKDLYLTCLYVSNRVSGLIVW